MWARVVEIMLGCWLLVTPFVFRDTPGIEAYARIAVIVGALAGAMSLLSFWNPMRFARFGTLILAFSLMIHGYVSAARPGPPTAQNEIVVGLVLLLFAILPNDVNRPPGRVSGSEPRSGPV
jgi:hypothetical protein